MIQKNQPEHFIKTYVTGFGLAMLVTFSAFGLVWLKILHGPMLLSVLTVLAIVQLYIHLRYFFNLEDEPKPRYKSTAFIFMMLVVTVVVFGSIWIMSNLHYNISSEQADTYIIEREGINK